MVELTQTAIVAIAAIACFGIFLAAIATIATAERKEGNGSFRDNNELEPLRKDSTWSYTKEKIKDKEIKTNG